MHKNRINPNLCTEKLNITIGIGHSGQGVVQLESEIPSITPSLPKQYSKYNDIKHVVHKRNVNNHSPVNKHYVGGNFTSTIKE